MKEYQFNAIIQQNGDMDASYIIFPYDLRAEFGKGQVKRFTRRLTVRHTTAVSSIWG